MCMNLPLKHILLLAITLFIYNNSYAINLDSIKTKKDLLQLLSASNNSCKVIAIKYFSKISRPEISRTVPAYIDTVYVTDPITQIEEKKASYVDAHTIVIPADTNTFYSGYSKTKLLDLLDTSQVAIHRADIDNNGYTDLIINVNNMATFVMIAHKGKQEIHFLSDSPDFYAYSFIDFIALTDGTKALQLKRIRCKARNEQSLDTVVYKFNNFMKYNEHFNPNGILKIQYTYIKGTGLGEDGARCIEINRNGECFGWFNYRLFFTTIDSSMLTPLWNMIAYIKVSTKNGHMLHINHATGCEFTIYYNDRTKVTIPYWGFNPPMDMGYLSKYITDICKHINWQPSQENIDIGCTQYYNELNNVSNEIPSDCDWSY